jgi:hypothetical protein
VVRVLVPSETKQGDAEIDVATAIPPVNNFCVWNALPYQSPKESSTSLFHLLILTCLRASGKSLCLLCVVFSF